MGKTGFIGAAIYIGEEYERVGQYTDNTENSTEVTYTTTWNYTFQGRKNTISLKVFGAESDCQGNLTCCKFGDRNIAIFGKTDNPHFYTNLVVFDTEYDPNSEGDI